MQELFVREMSEQTHDPGVKKTNGNCEVIDVLISLIVLIISQSMHVWNHHIVYLKYM